MQETCAIEIEDGVKITASFNLNDMTAHTLLEYEDWFEPEIKFIRSFIAPGMNAYDIGANHGVYAFAMAARLAGDGHVWAFEPTRKPLAMLAASLAANDFAGRVTVVPCALSDRAGVSRMGVSALSETSSLHYGEGETEEVRLQTLDAVWREQGEPRIDFIKLDAEGEEENILKGGRRFFAEQSPLLMFEAKNSDQHNLALLQAFRDMGYDLFRLPPGLGCLTPFDDGEELDPFQLNLFACKPDQAARLESRELLISRPAIMPTGDLMLRRPLAARSYAAAFASGWRKADEAVGCLLAAEERDRDPASRRDLLLHSLALLENDPHPSACFTQIRGLRAVGRYADALWRLRRLPVMEPAALAAALTERPFAPPFPAWDDRPAADGDAAAWCAAVLADAWVSCSHYSIFFDQATWPHLWAQRDNPNLTAGMRRRLLLPMLRMGARGRIPPGCEDVLLRNGPEHRNADVWRRLLGAAA